jgi:hypothetical protein
MNDSQQIHYPCKVSTWLLTVTLFLGLFAFSGYSGYSYSREKEAPKTELVDSIRANVKRAASYSRVSAQFHEGNARCDFRPYETLILAFHNQLFRTRINYQSQQAFCPQQFIRSFQRKTFPENSTEDLSISIRG